MQLHLANSTEIIVEQINLKAKMMTTETFNTWWGDYSLESGRAMCWDIGPLRLTMQRQSNEWLIAHRYLDRPEGDQEWQVNFLQPPAEEMSQFQVARYAGLSIPEQVCVKPALADRPVITRPFTTLYVPAGEKTTIYVSTPLWFQLLNGAPPTRLLDVPIQRPPDTWFGPSTREGELCYASRTFGRLNLENLIIYTYRAFTQIHIQNTATSPLPVERLNLPVPYLSLFLSAQGALWTESVSMIQSHLDTLAEFHIESTPPEQAGEVTLLTSPRESPHRGMLIRAFSALIQQSF